MTSEQEYSTVEISNIGYCFSPFVVMAEASSGITGMEFDLDGYIETLQFNGETEIRKDISGIMQALFYYAGMNIEMYDGLLENTSKQFNISISVYTRNGDDIHDFQNVTFVYGAVDYLNTYYAQNVNKKIKHFVNFPFGVDFLLQPGAVVSVSVEADNWTYSGDKEAIVCKQLSKPSLENGKSYLAYIYSGGVEVDTKRYPWIDTTKIEVGYNYMIKVDTCSEGVYLMWLNREGMRSFFLFKNKGVTTTVEGEEYKKTPYFKTAYIENTKQVNKTATKSISLAVSMADKEEYSYIEDVLLSPEVYMYDPNTGIFTRVTVEDGEFERTGAELQDFTFRIQLPEINTVKL